MGPVTRYRSYARVMTDDVRAAVILKSDDIARTLAWYRAAGFQARGYFPDADPTWCEVERDGTAIQFVAGETPWDDPPSLTGCVYVYPTSVDAVYDEIRDRVLCEFGVEDRPWGARELVVRDPDGYFVTFTEA